MDAVELLEELELLQDLISAIGVDELEGTAAVRREAQAEDGAYVALGLEQSQRFGQLSSQRVVSLASGHLPAS